MLDEVTDYYLNKEKANVESVFAVNGFGFAGRGQNTGIAFVSLKDWADRRAKNKVEAITQRATAAFSQIKDAMVFAFNLPAIVELGTATGFDFELIDRAGLGHEKLTQHVISCSARWRNILICWSAFDLTVWKIRRSLKSISTRKSSGAGRVY